MTTLVDLKRISYLTPSGSTNKPSLNYLSAKYKNIKFLLQAERSYLVTSSDAANLPGIAHKVYGDKDYWWIIGLYNGIIFPESDLVPGMVLQLPSLTDINTLLATQDADLLTNVLI
jgi:hypothetical protein